MLLVGVITRLCVFLAGLMFVEGDSWMSCPVSFNRFANRGGSTVGPCEVSRGNMIKTPVTPGQRLKVQWTSNNHGGGFVKLSLFPVSLLSATQAERDKYVLKMACYGHDERPGRYQYGGK